MIIPRTMLLILLAASMAGCTQPAGPDGGAEDTDTASPDDGTTPTDDPGTTQDDQGNFSEEAFEGKDNLIVGRHNPDGTSSSTHWSVLDDSDDDVKVRSRATQLVAQIEWTPAAPTTEWRFCLGIDGKIPDHFCTMGSQSPLELTLPPEGTNLTTGTYDPLFWVAEHDTAPANAGTAIEVNWEATVTYGNPE